MALEESLGGILSGVVAQGTFAGVNDSHVE